MITKNKLLYLLFTLLAVATVSCRKNQRSTLDSKGRIYKTTFFVNDTNDIVEGYDTLGTLHVKGFFTHRKADSFYKYNADGKTYKWQKYYDGHSTRSVEYDKRDKLEKMDMYLHDTIKVGWWDFYKNNKTEAKREYIILCDDQYLNQAIVFDKNGDTIYKKDDLFNATTFYKLRKVSDENFFRLYYDVRSIFSVKNTLQLIFLNGDNCEEDVDTIIELKSNRGYVDLDKKYVDKHGFFFDFYGYKMPKGSKTPYGLRHHKKYFDLKKVKLK